MENVQGVGIAFPNSLCYNQVKKWGNANEFEMGTVY